VHNITFNNENTSQHATSVLVTPLGNQSHYLYYIVMHNYVKLNCSAFQ